MIKVALVIPTLDRSGAEKQLALVAAGLPRDEFDVDVLTLTRGGPYAEFLRECGVRVTCLEKRWKFDLRALWRLRTWVREHQPHVVHSWLFAANSACRLVLPREATPAAIGRQHPALVIGERCVDSWKSGWRLQVDRWLATRLDRLVANSHSVGDFYARLGIPRERIVVIPNGVTPPAAPTLTRDEFLKQFDLPADARLVFYVGRLAPQKRIRDLLWSAQLLRQVEPRMRFIVVGDGPERDDLQDYAHGVEVARFVRFLGPRADAAALLHFADAFWLGSDFEGMSNSLMEAQACGVPVVVTDIPPNAELVRHDDTGYLVPVGDAAAFCQYTLQLLQSPETARRLGTAGQQRMASEFSIDKLMMRHVALYRELAQPV